MKDKIAFHLRDKAFKFRKWINRSFKIINRVLHSQFSNRILTDTEIKNIPIIINNFNRLECLLKLINRLEQAGYTNILILDNHSTYPPLLAYYKTCPYSIHYLNENLGFLALWKSTLYQDKFNNQFYVLTDPDVLPTDECPNDFMKHFYQILLKYPQLDKIGFSLKIDDIPDHYDRKHQVQEVESPYWKTCIQNTFYKAPIDTTFALYRPGTKGGFWLEAGRTTPPYTALHLPWYDNSENPNEESLYYRSQAEYSKNWS